MMNGKLIFIIAVILFIGQASAWSQTPVTYYNNWNNSGVINNLELDNMNPDKYPYKWDSDITNWYFYKNNDTLTLPKSIIDTIRFSPDRISFNITTTKAGVASKSIANGTGQRYINIPDSALKLRFVFDNVKPDVLIDNGTSQWYADSSTYWYSNVGGQIRFNFQTTPYASLAVSDKITFIFNSWLIDNAIVSGLTDVGLHSDPTVFTNNSILYLISGEYDGVWNGFNWTGSTWQADSSIVSGLTEVGVESDPTVFTNNSKLYLISGNGTGLWRGFNWTGTTWQSDTSIVSGLTDVGDYSSPTVFTNNSIRYLISGEAMGTFYGFNWTGSTWQVDNVIKSGLTDVGDYSDPTVFTNNSKLYLISGEYDGVWNGFNWTGSTWQADSSIVSGLTDVGDFSAPTVFTNNSKLYLISGRSTGLWTGWNTTYSDGGEPSTPQPNITSWSNDNTSNSTLSLSVNQNTNITFNITANQTLTSCSWTGATQINCSTDSYAYKLFDTIGTQYVNFTGSNTNGSTLNTVNWTITVNALPITEYIPPTPISLANTTGNFWINYTWSAGAGNVTDSYNVSITNNSIQSWLNGSSISFLNSTLAAHQWSNISVYAFNNSGNGTLNQTPISMNTQISNNPISLLNVSSSYNINEGDLFQIDANYTDIDGDTGLFSSNASMGSFGTGTGILDWQTDFTDAGVYIWYISVDDGYSSTSTQIFTVTVNDVPQTFMPPTPINCISINDTSWINVSCSTGTGNITNGMNFTNTNLSTWSNGTSFFWNNTGLTEGTQYTYHIYAYNNSEATALNLTYATVINTTLTTPTINPPNITQYWNSINGFNQTAMSVQAGNTVNFNVTVNQTITNISWKDNGAEQQNTSSLTYSQAFSATGTHNISAQGFNANGSSNIIYTVVTVTTAGGGGGTTYNWLDGNVKNSSDLTGIVGASIATNPNVGSTSSGAAGFYSYGYVFVQGNSYWINVSKTGYSDNNTLITFTQDHMVWDPLLTPIPINPSPNITSWSNTNTSNTNLSLSVSSGTNVTFNFTANQTLTSCSWGGATQINCTGTESYAYKNFTSIGIFYVTASGTNTNGTTQTITWTISSGGVISLDGYVLNTLGQGIPNARLDITGDGYQTTNATGYYNFNSLSGLTHITLIRAIGYNNLTTTHINTISAESMNFTLSEKSWATSDEAGAAGTMGFIGGIMGSVLIIAIIKRYWRA